MKQAVDITEMNILRPAMNTGARYNEGRHGTDEQLQKNEELLKKLVDVKTLTEINATRCHGRKKVRKNRIY